MSQEQQSEKQVKASTTYVYLISLVAAVAGFIFGYDFLIMSGAILFLRDAFSLSAAQEGFAMTSANYGVLIGLLIAGQASDRIGRKKTLLLAAALFGVSALGTAIPKTFVVWNIFRVLGGIGGGLAAMVSPMYIAEISPARIRGRLVTLNQLSMTCSSLVASISAFYLAKLLTENLAWRWMFASEFVPIFVLLIGLNFIPRSPRWLVQKGYYAEAQQVLCRVDGAEHAEREIVEIKESTLEEKGMYRELLKPGIRMALIIAVGLAAAQQLTGVSTLIFYAPTLFQKVGIKAASEAIGQQIIINSWVILCTLVAFWVVDKFGRRPLLLIGTIGMAAGQFLMGIVFQLNWPPRVALITLFLGVGAYVISVAPLAWLVMAEIFPTRLRARGMAVASIVLQLSAIAANQAFPAMLEGFQSAFGTPAASFWVFALFAAAAFVFCLKIVPETKGRSLEEIAKSWHKRN